MRRPHQMGIVPSEKLRFGALWRLLPRMLGFALPYWKVLAIGLAALTLGSGINLLFPALLRRLLNGELGVTLERDLGAVTLGLIALFALQAFVFYIRHRTFAGVGYRVVSDLRTKLFDSVIRKDITFYDTSRVGDLMSRLASDTQLMQNAISVNVSVALRYLLQIVGGIILMCTISLQLTGIILLLIPLFMGAGRFWGVRLSALSRKMQESLGEAAVCAEETLGAIKTVRVFAGSDYESRRYSGAINLSLSAGLLRAKTAAAFSSTMVFLMHSSIAAVLYFGGKLVIESSLTLGDLSAFLLYGVIVAVSFGFLISAFDEFMQAAGAASRIFELFDQEVTITKPAHPKEPDSNSADHIQFQGVTFAYPTRPETTVLSEITFSIPRGKTVALVGPSGSGKTTVAKLIPRFYDPKAGVIRYGDRALQELDPEKLRAEISIVEQECQVFSLSIAENIRYGRPSASLSEVRMAAEAAYLSEFIASLPEREETLVGDRGVQLSGGQRQRLAIARALLKDPKLLILDEATSALDSESESLVQEALSRLMKDRSTLIIAHRLSTVKDADLVLVLREGKIVQRGTHEELMDQDGLYRSFVELQLLRESEGMVSNGVV